jgi:hypothetical protein
VTRIRRCRWCRAVLPKGSAPTRRYCSARCRKRGWRYRQRKLLLIERAGASILGTAEGGPGTCPVCGRGVSIRSCADAVYCSPLCRTRAWRMRRGAD